MSYDIQLPKLSGNPATASQELQSYLFQMVGQLNWALNTIEKGESSVSNGNIIIAGAAEKKAEDNKQLAQDLFTEMKNLIIKSADICYAYQEKIEESFRGIFVAESDFGEYKSETNANYTKNSDGLQLQLESIESINEELKKINANIRCGALEDGEYGVEVGQSNKNSAGQTTFNKYARFTAKKLSFFDGSSDEEVAYISNQKLYITKAQVTGELRLGNYVCNTTNGVAFQWLGGA